MSSRVSKPKSKFTEEEDNKLRLLVSQFGILNWKLIARHMETKTERQIKERWYGYLNPFINTQDWTEEEDCILLKKYNEFGSKWIKITKFLRNRTYIQCKNRLQKLQRNTKKLNQLMAERERFPMIKQLADQEKKASELFDDEFDRFLLMPELNYEEIDFIF
jgi:hypothetical protein